MRCWITAALLALLTLGPALHAQPAPASPRDNAHARAKAALKRLGGPEMFVQPWLSAERGLLIRSLTPKGMTGQQATEACDTYLVPAMRARIPELLAQIEDILVQYEATAPALPSGLGDRGEQNRRNAEAMARVRFLAGKMTTVQVAWARQVAWDAFQENADVLVKMGMDPSALPK